MIHLNQLTDAQPKDELDEVLIALRVAAELDQDAIGEMMRCFDGNAAAHNIAEQLLDSMELRACYTMRLRTWRAGHAHLIMTD